MEFPGTRTHMHIIVKYGEIIILSQIYSSITNWTSISALWIFTCKYLLLFRLLFELYQYKRVCGSLLIPS